MWGAAGQKAGWQGSAFDPFGPDQARLNGLLAGTQCPSEDAALARREKDQDKLRKFVVPKINFKANFYFDMTDLDSEEKMEPPLTMELTDEEINSAVETPVILPAYPCHTQSVERAVGLVSESGKHRVGFVNRHRWILNTLASREERKTFNSKKDDNTFD